MAFALAFLAGLILGVCLIILFALCENRRLDARRHLAVSTAAFSDLNIDDARKIFSRQAFPRWMLFTEYEKVSWLNSQLRKAWPYVDKATSELTKTILEPMLEQYRPPIIASLKFQKFTFGTIAPQFVGIQKVETEDEEIVLDMEVQWDGNPSIFLAVNTKLGVSLPVQVKDIGVTGVFRVVFRPLVDTVPCFGAVMYSLREQKKLDFKLKVVGGDLKSFPMLTNAIDTMIRTAVTDMFLWPMRQVVPILPGDYSDLELRSCGILEVKLVQAKELLNMDLVGKSDPFAQLYIRPIVSRMKKTRTIDNNLNPIWNEEFQFEVEDIATQTLTIHVYDEDRVQPSERIGSAEISLRELEPGILTEFWLALVKDLKNSKEEKNRGQVQAELLYKPFDEYAADKASFNSNRSHSQSAFRSKLSRRPISYALTSKSFFRKATFHYRVSPGEPPQSQVGTLLVDVFRGVNLAAKDLNGLSDPYVVLQMLRSNQRMKTKVIHKTLNPEWNQTFNFPIDDSFRELLLVEVWDHDFFRKDLIGSCAVTLSKVLNEHEYKEEVELNPKGAGKLHLGLRWSPHPDGPLLRSSKSVSDSS